MSDNTEAWLATEDPTGGDLPATAFMGTKKDVEQTLEGLDPKPVGTLDDPKTQGGEIGETVEGGVTE